jgi:hypothetical protein
MKERRPSGEPVLAEVGPPVILSLDVAGYFSVIPPGQRARWYVGAVLCLCLALSAEAHPPYEDLVLTFGVPGQQVEVVKSYIDGIFFTDPAKLVLRSRGRVLAETEYHRDVSLSCYEERCLVVAADSPLFLVPERAWLVEGQSLREVGWGGRLLGVFVHFLNHWVGYLIAVGMLFCCVAMVAGVIRPPEDKASCLEILLAVAAAGVALLWLHVVPALTELSLLWSALGVATINAGWRRWRKRAG